VTQGALSEAHASSRLKWRYLPSKTKPDLAEQKIRETNLGSSGKKGAKSGSRLRLRELLKELLREFSEPSVLAYPKLRIKAALLRSGRKRKIGEN
jgi:hypothetical protein